MEAPYDSAKLRERNILVARTHRSHKGRDRSRGLVWLGQRTLLCVLGQQSILALKREGNGATPMGDF